jgi:hypothetical protein
MTDPRATLGNAKEATASARLPALVMPKSLDDEKGTLALLKAMKERLEVREGQRNNPLERAVTHRELQDNFGIRRVITAAGKPGTVFVQDAQGNTIALSAEHFAQLVFGTQLWRTLSANITDPNRFDLLGKVKALLLPDLGELAAQRGAAIQTVQTIVQEAGESFAAQKTEITAAIDQHVAGVRETLWAEANNLMATAGKALQITARLDNVDGSGASLEEVYSVVAGPDGLSSQYTLKANAGGAFAAIGLAATSPTAGPSDSYIIFVADNFAFVRPTDTIGTGAGQVDPTNPGASRIPFGIDSSGIFINGNVRIDATGPALNTVPALSTSYWLTSSVGAILRDTTATYVPATITFNAYSAVGTTGPAAYSGRFKIYHSTDGTSFTLAYTSSANESSKTYTPPSGKVAIKCELYLAGGTTTKIDETIVPIVDAGSNAITVVVSNPAQTVPSDNAGTVSSYSNTGTTIQVYEGANLLTFTTGTIGDSKFTCGTPTLSPTSSITVGARSGNGTTTLTVANHSAMTQDSVQITYPLTIQKADGSTVSWSPKQVITKSKTGADGGNGTRGSFTGNGFQYGIRSSTWSDTLAQRVIENMNTGGTSTSGIATGSMTAPGMVLGDTVTLGSGNPWWTTLGAYSSATAYVNNDIVISSSIAYRAIQPSTNKTPASNPTYWAPMGAINATGAWAASHAYAQNDTATSSGVTYLAKWKHTSDATSLANDLATADVAMTKYWGGAAWLLPGVFIDGNLLVSETVSANALYGGTIGGVDINLTGSAVFGGQTTGIGGATAAVVANSSYGADDGIHGLTNTNSVGVHGDSAGTGGSAGIGVSGTAADVGIGVNGFANGAGVGVFAEVGSTSGTAVVAKNSGGVAVDATGDVKVSAKLRAGGTPNTDAAVIGYGTSTLHGGRFHHSSGRAGFIASGSASFDYDFYADGSGTNYGPFTGAHDALILKDADAPEPGDIVVDVTCVRRANISNTIFDVERSSAPNQKGALGVATRAPVAWTADETSTPAALKQWDEVDGVMVCSVTMDAVFAAETHDFLSVNAVGEGQINVCNEGGDIEVGDLIVCSSTPGKGMKQADDIVRNYTVAKAREAVTFDGPDDIKTVACTYHCG